MINKNKYGVLFILGCILMHTVSFAQLELQEVPTSEDLTTVFFLDTKTGFAGGANGVVLKTSDGGRHWFDISPGTENTINGIGFLSSDTGFIVGENKTFLRTNNGGEDWIDINPGLDADFTAICFVSDKTGFVVGHGLSGGIFMKTANGGNSWSHKIFGLQDNTIGYSGNTVMSDIYLTNLSFYDENSGLLSGFTYDYSIGKFPFICKTDDGGETFINISPEISKNDWYVGREIVSVNYMNKNDACAIVNSGAGSEFLLISDYKVSSFAKNNYNSNFDSRGRFFNSVFLGRFIAYFTGIIDGESKILKTIDQGGSYMFLTPPVDKSLYASCFTDINNGYFVGEDGTILHLYDKNNIVYSMAGEKNYSSIDPPFTIAYTKSNLKKTYIHVYNIDAGNASKFNIDMYDSHGNKVEIKRSRVRIYSDEIRIKVKTDELHSATYFYSVNYEDKAVANGKIDLGTYVRNE